MDHAVSPLKVIKEAIAAVPAVRYALGISGIVAAIALIFSLGIDSRVAIFGTVIMLILMALLVIFARLTALPNKVIALPAIVFTWFSLLLVMATATVLFTSVFFKRPVDLQYVLRPADSPLNPAPVEKPVSVPAAQEGSRSDSISTESVIKNPEKPPEPVPCRHPEHGIEKWNGENLWNADSGWRGGGSSPGQYCGEQLLTRQQQYPDRKIELIDSGEEHKSEHTPFKHDYYKYRCSFREFWDPIYKLAVSEHCPQTARS